MSIWKTLKALHNDEQGAELIEYILIIAAIALPVVGIIIWFRNDITEWFKGEYEGYKDSPSPVD